MPVGQILEGVRVDLVREAAPANTDLADFPDV